MERYLNPRLKEAKAKEEPESELSEEERLKEGEPKNASFLTLENINWWLWITMNYLPSPDKRAFFLPCAGGFKTRNKMRMNTQGEMVLDPRKFISESKTHNVMKAIREDAQNEKIILSEPLTLIPYDNQNGLWESHPNRPDYNLPVDFLSVQGEFIFIERLSHYLLKMKCSQPERKYIFYFGGAHHYFILDYSNILAGLPFQIIYKVPAKGSAFFTSEAEKFMAEIHAMEASGSYIVPEPISIQAELLKRTGRYTHKPFLLALIEAERLGASRTEVKETRIEISSRNVFQEGFGKVYSQIVPIARTDP